MIIAANFKTNHTRKSTKKYMTELSSFVNSLESEDKVLVFPPCTALDSFELNKQISVGAQNAYPAQNGSFTGEIGTDQLDEFAVKTVLIGHSERRHVLGEKQSLIARKYAYYAELGYEIVYCIGEPLEVRESSIESVMEYNLTQLEGIDLSYENLIVAYEPVWAIGTGLTASVKQIEETLANLKETIKAPLLYGGSVKVANTKEILEIDNCEGILVGTASWEVDSFCQMVEIAKSIS